MTYKDAQAITKLIIDKHGIPGKTISNNGREFDNAETNDLKQKYNFNWKYSPPFHHEMVGAVERANQTLQNKLIEFGKHSWEKALPQATTAANLSFNRAIKTAPYLIKYGYIQKQTPNKPIEKIRKQRDDAFDNYAKTSIEKGKRSIEFNLKVRGDVLMYREPLKGKFSQTWWPGYKIKEIKLPAAYIVTNGKVDFRLNKSHVKLDESQGGRGDVVSNSATY